MTLRLPAEWEAQDGILLAWPHAGSDWAPDLPLVEPVFAAIAAAASFQERVLIIAPDPAAVLSQLAEAGALLERIRCFPIPSNDTWARDCGPITVVEQGRPVLLDFGFNGWGLKFAG